MRSGRDGLTRRQRALAGAALALALCVTLLASLFAFASGGQTPRRSTAGAGQTTAHSAVRSAAATRLGPTDPARALTLTFPLRHPSSAALAALLSAIEDPASPQYHRYLTSAQYAAAFGPSASERDAAVAALRALGLSVTAADGSADLVQADGSVGVIEADFGVRLSDYRSRDGSRYVAPDGVAQLPSALAAEVTGVVGLDTRPAVERRSPQLDLAPGQVGGGGLDPSALRAAYDVTPLITHGLDGSGETIAVAEIDRFRQSDISTYDSAFGLTTPAVQVVSVAGGSRTLSPEPVLDIEILHAIAPKARIIAYESGSDLRSLTQMFDRIVSDNRAQVVSISLGACELGVDNSSSRGFISALDSIFQRADAQGMSVLVSSGDSGAYGCQDNHLSVDLPAASPFVTAVGGTAYFAGANDGYGHEDGWEGPLEGAGGGGGLSVIYKRPTWQTGPGVSNSFSDGMRETPDISADADPLTGYRIYYSGDNNCSGNDCWTVVGGTSAAAPFWAGLIALANQQGHRTLGFLNPALYAIGQAGASSGSGAPYHDVTSGGNLYYQATPGWDYSTGWGSPDAAVLIPLLLAR